MILSNIITPFRWYDDFFEQERFTKDCQHICPFELITDKTRLIPFQFKRDKSPYGIDKFFLRKACNNYYEKLGDINDSLFTLDTGTWTKVRFNIANGYAKSTGGTTGSMSRNGLTVGKNYHVKIIVTEIYKATGGSFTLEPSHNASSLDTITIPGTYEYTFTATGTDFELSYASSSASNYVIVQEVSIDEIVTYNSGLDDVELDPAIIEVFTSGDYDYFQHCGSILDNPLPACDYYAVIETYDSVYFSEVFKVKDFIPSQSPYILLEWWNSCNVSDVTFSQGCGYKNRLYINGIISKPEYPFKEEGEEDGDNNLNITFQKWEKQRTLNIQRLPEFVLDAITALRLHDNLYFTESLRKNQFKVGSAIEFDKAETSLTPVLGDCATTVDLKMTLKDRVVDALCCTSTTADACQTCSITIPQVDVLDEATYEYGLVLTDPFYPPGLYQWINDAWTLIPSDPSVLICDLSKPDSGEGSGFWQYQPDNPLAIYSGYVFCPQWHTITHVSGSTYFVKGNILKNSYGEVEFSIDGGTTWIPALPRFTRSQFYTGLNITLNPVPCCDYFGLRIRSFDLNGCSYGYSEAWSRPAPTNDCC